MPVRPKPPKPGTADVNAHLNPPADSAPPGAQPLRFTPDPFVRNTPLDTGEPARAMPEREGAVATHNVQVHPLTSTSASVSTAQIPALQRYLIPSAIALPDADAQGFRVFKGRQYVDVQGGGTVLIAVDMQTGLYRARLASEAQPSGPALAFDPLKKHWYLLQDFSAPDGSVSAAQINRRVSRQSDEAFESALEELPGDVDGADETFYLASESMPFKPFTTEELNTMRSETRCLLFGNTVGSYNRANNGKYPLRDIAGKPIRIRKLQTSVSYENGDVFTSGQIKPYIKFEGYAEVARLYEEKLQWRIFTEDDVSVPGERALIGQSMVVANRRIAKGETLGVYGGTITPARFVPPHQQTFAMLAGTRYQFGVGQMVPDPLAILGDNILSRINSSFEYDATGKPVRQAREGYNVELVPFDVKAEQWLGQRQVTRDFKLNVVFASQDIPAGTELRLNYNYNEKDMSRLFP